jgi:hypothetical protein
MKKYWFERFEDRSSDYLKKLSNSLMSSGYDGMMLPYHTHYSDQFIKVARFIDKENFDYIFGLRTHTSSPQYLRKVCQSIYEISNKKIGINIISGHIYDHEKIEGETINEINDFSNKDLRRKSMINFVKNFYTLYSDKEFMPKLYLSGTHPETMEAAKKYCDAFIMARTMPYEKNINIKRIVMVQVLIRDSKKECEDFIESKGIGVLSDLVYGSKEDVIKYFDELKKDDGVEAVLIDQVWADDQLHRVHEIVNLI